MIEAHEIADKEFVPSLRGYNRSEVRAFLRAVARDYQHLLDRLTPAGPVADDLAKVLELQLEILRNQEFTVGDPVDLAELRELITVQQGLIASQGAAARQLEEAAGQLQAVLDGISKEKPSTAGSQKEQRDGDIAGRSDPPGALVGVVDVADVDRDNQPARRRSASRQRVKVAG